MRTKEVNFSISYKPTPYLSAAIAEAEKEYAETFDKSFNSLPEKSKRKTLELYG